MKILIKNGTVIDGSGEKQKHASILIEDHKIKKIGILKDQADKIIDAAGLFVTPGFIDVNNDSDHHLTLLTAVGQQSFIFQGVTTVIGGNCGASLAPLVEGNIINSISKWSDISSINVDWSRVSEFFGILNRLGLGLNYGMLCGHTTLRRGILKDDVRELKPDEILKMRFLLDQALQDGALGMSAGLAYSHAKITPTEELIDLARVIKDYNGVFAMHLRGESDEVLPAVKEAIDIARNAKVPVEISHFKISGKENWHHLPAFIKMIDDAFSEGLEVNFDVYPYDQSASVIYIMFPDWVTRGGRYMMTENLKDATIRKKVIEELRPKRAQLAELRIADARYDVYVGRNLGELAKNQGVRIEEAAVNLFLANDGYVTVFAPSISPENLDKEILHLSSFIGSNGAGYNIGRTVPKELIHPRSFGTFPKFLRHWVREQKLLTWEEAIYKITMGPAKKFRLQNRGLLKENYFADVAVFDPEKIKDKATFENPFQYSEGIEYLFINGSEVIEKGKYGHKLAGQIIKRGS